MQHYREKEWHKYVLGEMKEDEAILMEEHLYSCDDCMATYLSLMEEISTQSIPALSEDFTDQVLQQLKPSSSTRRTLKKKEIFKYYVVAASITMLLMYSGFFNVLVNEIPRATDEMISSTKRVEELVPVGWSQRLMDTTLATLNTITIKQGSDNNEN